MKGRLERHIENMTGKRLLVWATREGVPLEYLKCEVPGIKGFPDRIILWEGGHTLFVEFKRPTLRPTKLQNFRHEKLRSLGFEVHVYDNIDNAVAGITQKIRATARADQGH